MDVYLYYILCVALWIVCYANSNYRISQKFDSYRFRLFTLRDKLAHAAMTGCIPSDSKEYLVLCSMINVLIKNAETYDPISLIGSITTIKNDPEVAAEIDKIREAALSGSYPIQKEILNDFFSIARDLFDYNTRSLIWLISLLKSVVESHERLSNWKNNVFSAKEFLREQQDVAACRC